MHNGDDGMGCNQWVVSVARSHSMKLKRRWKKEKCRGLGQPSPGELWIIHTVRLSKKKTVRNAVEVRFGPCPTFNTVSATKPTVWKTKVENEVGKCDIKKALNKRVRWKWNAFGWWNFSRIGVTEHGPKSRQWYSGYKSGKRRQKRGKQTLWKRAKKEMYRKKLNTESNNDEADDNHDKKEKKKQRRVAPQQRNMCNVAVFYISRIIKWVRWNAI